MQLIYYGLTSHNFMLLRTNYDIVLAMNVAAASTFDLWKQK